MRAWREHDTCLQDPAIAANAVVTVVTMARCSTQLLQRLGEWLSARVFSDQTNHEMHAYKSQQMAWLAHN